MPLTIGNRQRKRLPFAHLATRIFETPVAILPAKMAIILAALAPRLGLTAESLPVVALDDLEDDEQDDQLEINGGVATINVNGTLVRRSTGMNARSGMTSYESLTRQFLSAVSDSSVKSIVLRCDSPGGEVPGMLELADTVFQSRGQKPIVAVIDDCAASAAYALAAQADRIIVSRTGMAGSVGCFMVHADRSGQDAQRGVKYTFVFSGAQKIDGNEHAPLSQNARREMQAECDRIRGLFVDAVARGRGVSPATVLATQAGVRFGPANLPLFADQVGTYSDVIGSLCAASLRLPTPAAPAALPAASRQRLLPAPAVTQQGDAAAWLRARANVPMSPALAGVAERLRTEHSAIAAKYGSAVEARLIQFPRAHAAVRSAPSAGGRKRIDMLVAPWNSLSIDLGGGIIERYEPHCFDLSRDVRALWNHDDACVLGRKANRTCEVLDGPDGLHCIVPDVPDTTFGQDLIEMMERGDVNQSSASFWIIQARVEIVNGKRVRVIERAVLRDCSVVAFAAYETTTATVIPELAAAAARLDRLRQPAASNQHYSLQLAEARLRLLRTR